MWQHKLAFSTIFLEHIFYFLTQIEFLAVATFCNKKVAKNKTVRVNKMGKHWTANGNLFQFKIYKKSFLLGTLQSESTKTWEVTVDWSRQYIFFQGKYCFYDHLFLTFWYLNVFFQLEYIPNIPPHSTYVIVFSLYF